MSKFRKKSKTNVAPELHRRRFLERAEAFSHALDAANLLRLEEPGVLILLTDTPDENGFAMTAETNLTVHSQVAALLGAVRSLVGRLKFAQRLTIAELLEAVARRIEAEHPSFTTMH